MSDTKIPVEVVNNPAQKRFEAQVEGQLAVAEYIETGKRLVLTHTEVPEALEGRGIASQLAMFAFEYARHHEKVVVPLCPYMAGYVRRHPEYRDLVLQGYRL